MNNDVYPLNARRGVPIDGIGVRPNAARSAPQPVPPRRPFSQPRPAPAATRSRWQTLQLPLLLLGGTLGGFFADTLAIGLALVVVYAAAAFVTRIPSRTTFSLALLLLGAISVMLLIKPSLPLMRNFSTYAFMLLIVGVITLGREARRPKPMHRKYRR
jgi:hypothetical protein